MGRTALRRLADQVGVLASYVDIEGEVRETSDEARVAALRVMGFDVDGEVSAARELVRLEQDPNPSTVVATHGRPIWLPLPAGPRAGWSIRVEAEGQEPIAVDVPPRAGRVRLPDLPTGFHRVRVRSADASFDTGVVVAPRRCVSLDDRLGGARRFGLWANLYTLRQPGEPIGHLGALRELIDLAAERGAAFVGISPLHAQRNKWLDVSPYNGLSRIFRNPIYLDPASVPEAVEASADPDLAAADLLDYPRVASWHREATRLSFERFWQSRHSGERGRLYRQFCERDDGLAVDWGTFMALTEHFEWPHGVDWRAWPEKYRDPRSEAVAAFRRAHEEEVHYHVFLQFELDLQLGRLAARARDAGMAIGIYQDLALGVSIAGFDAWAFPDLFLHGASIGAPPDPYAAEGQDWGIPPMDPRRLDTDGFRYLRLMLREAMVHSGALRIDHAMGLLRQYWVPAGEKATHGCYVSYPMCELLSVIALNSHRHDCVVIAEDLGTVPEGFADELKRAGILSSQVMLFEREDDGAFRPASRYSRRALVTANTHDHPTLAGWCAGRDLEIRRQVGELAVDALAAALEERRKDVRRLVRRLRAARVLTGRRAPEPYPDLCRAVYGFLCGTPAPLVGVSLDDLAGEIEPINVPGVPQDVFASWTRRMSASVAELAASDDVRSILAALEPRAGGGSSA